jgi:GWxTD domain-containing protein
MSAALSTALLHFVWQGAAIAFSLAVALRFAHSSRARYALACAALLAMPLAFAVTAWVSWPAIPSQRFVTPFFYPPVPDANDGAAMPQLARWNLVALWFTGVVLFYLWRFAGWVSAQRLCRRGVCAPPEQWTRRAQELAHRMRLLRPVVLLESSLADAPLTLGSLRPVILMPLGVLTGLPSNQVEAILLHELAHIRRHDYFVNLAQSIVEGLLFYHPAVWWVSHVIRREREMACDDLVIAATGDAPAYAHALTQLEERRTAFALSLAANGGPLMTRILRILGNPVPRATAAPAVMFLLLAGAAALFAFQPAPAPQDDRTDNPYLNWLNQEVVWIIAPDEREAFLRLGTDDERRQFIEQFWLRRDPTPGTLENEFQQEHYRRIAWANDRFSAAISGWKTDRGAVYIKYGPPDEKEEHPNDPVPSERWRYRIINGIGADVIIEFLDRDRSGLYQMTLDPAR